MSSKFIDDIKEIYPEISIGKAQNIQGKRFGKLIALYRTKNKNKMTQWVTKCDCGNYAVISATNLQQQKTKSCGCLRLEKSNNLIGKKFGRLTVIEKTEKRAKNRQVFWKCLCDCGTECEIRTDSLTMGKSQSCGCFQKEKARETGLNSALDISNQRFGYLIALQPTSQRDGGNIVWKCQCDCGNTTMVGTHSLISGNKFSCGCANFSSGELIINQILKNNNIVFETQKTFDNCRFIDSKMPARFDFYVNQEYLIEYDGKQHYTFSNYGWYTQESFNKIKEHDNFKEQWCKNNNIPLIRIPYTHKNIQLEDLLLNTSKFIKIAKKE